MLIHDNLLVINILQHIEQVLTLVLAKMYVIL